MNASAKFLVLLDSAPRALLLDSNRRLMGEVIEDDGFIVETLLRTARACPLMIGDSLDAVLAAPSDPVRCFELC
jgi:hypothetical protein